MFRNNSSIINGNDHQERLLPIQMTNYAPVYPPVHNDNVPLLSPNHNTSSSPSSSAPSTEATAPPQPAESKIRLNLRTLAGQVMSVEFGSLDGVTVLDVKRAMDETHSIPVSFQRLIFGGRELVDNELVSAYGMENGCMIHLLLRQNQSTNPAIPPTAADGTPIAIQNGMLNAGDLVIPVAPVVEGPVVSAGDQERYTKAFQLSRALKMFVIIDLIIIFLWINTGPVRDSMGYSLASLVAAALAVVAYVGVHRYHRNLSLAYLGFIGMCIGLRITAVTLNDSEPSFIALMTIGVLIDLYIFKLALVFIRIINTFSVTDRIDLMQMTDPQYMANGNGW